MAVVMRVGKPSLSTTLHDPGWHQIKGRAAVALPAGSLVYLKNVAGVATLDLANGTAAGALTEVVGMIPDNDVPAGEKATAYQAVEIKYGTGLVPGKRYFLSATAGHVEDIATAGGTAPVAMATTTELLYIFPVVR